MRVFEVGSSRSSLLGKLLAIPIPQTTHQVLGCGLVTPRNGNQSEPVHTHALHTAGKPTMQTQTRRASAGKHPAAPSTLPASARLLSASAASACGARTHGRTQYRYTDTLQCASSFALV